MSQIGSYPTRTFKESQKFLVLDPETQSASLVLGRDLVSYLTPSQNYVYAESTRATAQATDYPVGALIETAGATSQGDNFAAVYLVVAAGQGDFPMDNGNELLVIRGDEFLREQLVQPVATFNNVADMVADLTLPTNRKARTLGYYAPGDGGGNDYEIVAGGTGTADGGSFINLDNGLQAKGLFEDGAIRSKQFGLVSDGVADDATKFIAAEAYAKSQEKMLVMSPGTDTYISSATLSGRVLLGANKDAIIRGEVKYDQSAFPTSANTLTPLVPSDPYFYCYGIDFVGPDSSAFGLQVTAPAQGNFIVTAAVQQCRFYGRNGLLAQNLITYEVSGCQFFNTAIGEQLEGCTNVIHSDSVWHNQAAYGVNITEFAADNSRLGGELISFVNCEWAVCSTAVKAYRSRWLRFNSCLIDFTGLPLHLLGCRNLDIAGGNYFGASNTYQNLSTVTGYVAPPTDNMAIYAVTSDDVGNAYITSGKISDSVLACYNDSSSPLAFIDGASTETAYGCQNLIVDNVTFFDNNAHTANTLLQIDNAKGVQVTGNQFIAPNAAGTPSNPYILNTVVDYHSYGNDTTNFLDSVGNEVVAEFDAPDIQNGVRNNQFLKFLDSAGGANNVMVVNAANKVVVRAISGAETIELQDSSGLPMARFAGADVSVNFGGTLKKLEQGAVDTAGTGFRNVRVVN